MSTIATHTLPFFFLTRLWWFCFHRLRPPSLAFFPFPAPVPSAMVDKHKREPGCQQSSEAGGAPALLLPSFWASSKTWPTAIAAATVITTASDTHTQKNCGRRRAYGMELGPPVVPWEEQSTPLTPTLAFSQTLGVLVIASAPVSSFEMCNP